MRKDRTQVKVMKIPSNELNLNREKLFKNALLNVKKDKVKYNLKSKIMMSFIFE